MVFVLANPSKTKDSKSRDQKSGIGAVEAAKEATGEEGSKGTKRKQGWKGWVILEDPEELVQVEECKAHSKNSPIAYGDDSNARRKSKRIKRD